MAFNHAIKKQQDVDAFLAALRGYLLAAPSFSYREDGDESGSTIVINLSARPRMCVDCGMADGDLHAINCPWLLKRRAEIFAVREQPDLHTGTSTTDGVNALLNGIQRAEVSPVVIPVTPEMLDGPAPDHITPAREA